MCNYNGPDYVLLGTEQLRPARQRIEVCQSVTHAPLKRMSIGLPSLLLLCSCVSYRELGTLTPARGSEVVVTVAQPLAIPLEEVTVREVNVASGRVTYADADSLVLAVQQFSSISGAHYPGLGTQITIERGRIATLRQRKVAPARTALLLGLGAGALVAIVTSVGPLLGSGSNGPPEPPPQP